MSLKPPGGANDPIDEGASVAINPGSAVTVTTSSSVIVLANPSRRYLQIQNFNTSEMVFVKLGATAVLTEGGQLNPNGGTWVCPPYSGAVEAIATGSAIVGIVEV